MVSYREPDGPGGMGSSTQCLMQKFIRRNNAIHAIATVLFEYLSDLTGGKQVAVDQNPTYFTELKALTVEGWRRECGTPS